MLREGLSHFTNTGWLLLGLGIFFVTFIGVVVWTYRRSARKHYEKMARLPLDERQNDVDE